MDDGTSRLVSSMNLCSRAHSIYPDVPLAWDHSVPVSMPHFMENMCATLMCFYSLLPGGLQAHHQHAW